MDWKQTLRSAKGGAEQVLAQRWPQVQQVFTEKVGPAALAAATDEETLARACRLVYQALPLPVRIVVAEDAFVRFCLEQKDRLLPPAAEESRLAGSADQSRAADVGGEEHGQVLEPIADRPSPDEAPI